MRGFHIDREDDRRSQGRGQLTNRVGSLHEQTRLPSAIAAAYVLVHTRLTASRQHTGQREIACRQPRADAQAEERRGVPLLKFECTIDLDWAVDGFCISSSGVGDETQIHTHTCYSEFNEMKNLILLARKRLSESQLWINPDCGLKTRRWEEVRPALVNMVAAARELRASS
jgi:methionine synthase II (cobalamin-independent)